MVIEITSGTGKGPNALAAFDKALFDGGIANYNLIPLSSVIPSGTEIRINKSQNAGDAEYGFRLYVVIASKTASAPGQKAVAGLGWVQNAEVGKGLFVEHTGDSREEVEKLIRDSLTSMRSYRQEDGLGEIQAHIVEAECIDEPVCALAAAIYKKEGWQ